MKEFIELMKFGARNDTGTFVFLIVAAIKFEEE